MQKKEKEKDSSGARRDNLETFVLKLGYDAMTELIGSSFINGVLSRQSPLNPAKFLIVESRSTTSLTDSPLLENGE